MPDFYMAKEVRFSVSDEEKADISIVKLVLYNLLFFVPIGVALYISVILANMTYQFFETSPRMTIQFYMLIFVFLIFFIVIPFIRRRENVRGVRYSLFGFFIVAIGLSLPSIIVNRDFSILYNMFNHLAIYILLTFIYCPEVLGMDVDLSKWFKSYKQMLIIFVYVSIVTLFVLGYGWYFYGMYQDGGEAAFSISVDKEVTYGTFIYYSIVSFTTIGYGEITPLSTAARLFTSIEAMIGMITNVIFVAILFVYISNFQAFIKSQEKEIKEIKREEKAIRKEEKAIKKEEKKLIRLEKKYHEKKKKKKS